MTSPARFEYTFVRIAQGWLFAKRKQRDTYQQIIEEHAREGWRLVQIFAPGIGAYGAARYYELVLERPIEG